EDQARLAPLAVAEEAMDVRPADARRVDLQERLARLRRRDRNVLDLDLLRTHVDERFHEASFEDTPADGSKRNRVPNLRRRNVPSAGELEGRTAAPGAQPVRGGTDRTERQD